jgi:hypothetical protein
VETPAGLVEDTIPEDQSLVLNTPEGLVVITGCGHAGIVNILTFSREQFPNEPVQAVIGGLHLFPASDQQLDWTADKLKEFKRAKSVGRTLHGHRGGLPPSGQTGSAALVRGGGQRRIQLHSWRRHPTRSIGQITSAFTDARIRTYAEMPACIVADMPEKKERLSMSKPFEHL